MNTQRDQALESTLEEWRAMRALTLDLLDNASPDFLEFQPDETLGPVWKQYRHLGRVQENYTAAICSGAIQFDPCAASFTGNVSPVDLADYLQRVDREMLAAIDDFATDGCIDWWGETCSLTAHLVRLVAHETLHHGQFIFCARIAGVALPTSWAAWGE